MTLGVLSRENLQRVTKSGTYTVHASLEPTSETTNLQIPHTISDGQVLDWFDLEIKQQGGVFENISDASMNGVTVRLVTDHRVVMDGSEIEPIRVNASLTSSFGTLLIDAHPKTLTFLDAPVAVGQELDLGIATIEVLTAGLGVATVKVTFADTTPPTGPPALSVRQVTKSVVLDWKPSSDDTGVAQYLIFRDGEQIGTSSQPGFTDSEPSVGSHAYRVYAEDIEGHRSESSALRTITVLDVTAPTDPDRPSASQVGPGVSLAWGASSDDVGVARYLVFRDDVHIASSQRPEYLDPGPAPGSHTYRVVAEDAQFNRSGSSPAATIEVARVDVPAARPAGKSLPQPPLLRLHSRSHGRIGFEVDARAVSGVTKIELLLDGRPLRSARASTLMAIWHPVGRACGETHRLTARAYDSEGAFSTASLKFHLGKAGRRCVVRPPKPAG
jgi:hypothetical protein